MTDDFLDALPISGVTGVTRVQTHDDGDSDVTPNAVREVTEVTTVADLLANAMEPDEAKAQHDTTTVVPESDRPCFRVYDGWTVTDTGRKLRPGVWLHTMSAPKGNNEPVPTQGQQRARPGGFLGLRAAVCRSSNLRRYRQQLRSAAALQEHGGPLADMGHAYGTAPRRRH